MSELLDRAFPGDGERTEFSHEKLMINHGRQFAVAIVELSPDACHESWNRFRETVGLVNVDSDKVGSEIAWQSLDNDPDKLYLFALSTSIILGWPIDDEPLIEILQEFRCAAIDIDSYRFKRTGKPLLAGILHGRQLHSDLRSNDFYLDCADEVFKRDADESLRLSLRAQILS